VELREREKYADQLGRSLAKLSARHDAELSRLLGEPADLANVPPEFWARVEDETRQQIAVVLILIWLTSAASHGLASGGTTQVSAESWTAKRSTDTARGYVATTQERLGGLRGDELRERAGRVFTPERARGIGQTEAVAAQTAGGEAWVTDARSKGLIVRAVIRHSRFRPAGHSNAPKKPCPICSPLEGLVDEAWRVIAPAGPPFHPWCLCYVEYELLPAKVTKVPIW
jgi:hypothetical protein